MNSPLEQSLLKYLKDELQKTDIEFGIYQRSRISLELADAYDEDAQKDVESNINRLRFRYHWIEGQISEIQSFNKK